MKKLTFMIDDWGHKELQEYLNSLKGMISVEIKNEKKLEINLKYDETLITPDIIKMEILFFLELQTRPSILAFDKHYKNKTSDTSIIIDDLCCEYCLKNAIEELFHVDGIECVTSNFVEGEFEEKVILNIKYNSHLINHEKIKQIELKLNL